MGVALSAYTYEYMHYVYVLAFLLENAQESLLQDEFRYCDQSRQAK